MARAGSSSRFVSVNLSKSYGQAPSPLPGSSVSGSSSTGYRARSQSGQGGMVVLSRPGRSQSSVSSTSSRTSKLAIPRPVNLPSLRSEHAGNDPTVPIVGTSGSAGWSKQQVLPSLPDSTASHTIPADSAAVRSASMNAESSWSTPATQAKAEGENMQQRAPFFQSGASYHQTPAARSSLYTPPSSRNYNAVNILPNQHVPPSEKAMVVRGEEFPTLQAAVRPLAVPALQRQRDMPQKQRDKQHEIRDQHVKLQELSQQRSTKVDMLELEHYAVPQLQPSRPQQAMPKQPSIAEGKSYNVRRTAEKEVNKFNGPSPLIRLTHTSNWGDDERETLQSAHGHGLMQADRPIGRPRNGSQVPESWAKDSKVVTDTGRPASRNGFSSAYGRDHKDLRDDNRTGARDMVLSNGAVKNFPNQQFDVDSWEDLTSWSRGAARNDNSKHDWTSPKKDVSSNLDSRFANSSRSVNSRTTGLTRDMHTSTLRDVDLSHGKDNTGRDKFARDVRSRDGSNRLEFNSSKHGMDDRQGDRFRKSVGAHQYGRSNLSSASRMHAGGRSDLSGLDYGREKRVSVLFGQDPFTDEPRSSKPVQSLAFETFVSFSGFEGKITKKKKDELADFRDPARELFEAELERVQKMQEQERQRLAEERERAIELARKEEEEREKRAIEEELLRLKLEAEAREAIARARREQEEAARKAEEIRKVREEEKRMIVVEEERRKEAARKKLLELEQRMALRGSGRDVNAGSAERARKEDVVLQDEHRGLQRFDKFDKHEDHGLSRGAQPLQMSVRTELVDSSQVTPLESPLRRPFDSRGGEGFLGDRLRVVQMKRQDTLDDGPEVHSTMKSYHHRDIPSHELDRRSFSAREWSAGSIRNFREGASQSSTMVYGQDRTPADSPSRKERWQSGYGDRISGGHLPTGKNTGYMDFETERDNDVWWSKDNHRKFQEGQRLNSPPLFPYSNGGENEFASFGRIRQSMPKQPRVPPPISGRLSSQKQISQSESMQAVSPLHKKDGSDDLRKDDVDYSSQEMLEKKGDSVDWPHIGGPSPDRPFSAVPTEMIAPPNHPLKVFDESEGGLKDGSQAFNEDISQPDEIDQFSEQLSDLTESEEQSREDEKQLAFDMQVSDAVAYADDDDAWVGQGTVQDMGEELSAKEEQVGDTVQDELEDHDWESLKTHEDPKGTWEHGNQEEKIEEPTWESQHVEDAGDVVVDDSEGAADSQRAVAQSLAPKTEKQDEREVENLGLQEIVKGGPADGENISPSANALNYMQVGQSEGHNRVHSFMQQFQQPFSFMAVPLPQSTTVNGVPLHPPMLPSMHNLQTQQDLPYHLQMGLLHNAPPLMPNAIQIGSIQMPLQVHPQIPSVAHQHQHPPLFQFGQICQFSQPVPPMQPSFQMHHALGQPLTPQPHQANFLPTKEGSESSKLDDSIKELEQVPVGLSASSTVSVGGPGDSLLSGSLISKEHQNSGASLGTASQTIAPSVESGPKDFSTPDANVNVEANQETLVGKITGSRRRNSNARSYGIYGRGKGRSYPGKSNDLIRPYSAVEISPENSVKAAARNRTYRQNFRRAEYKIRKPPVVSEESELSQVQENVPDITCNDASDKCVRPESFTVDDTLDSRFYSASFGETDSQLTEAAPSLQSLQTAVKTTKDDIVQARIGCASTSSNQTQGNSRNLKADELGESALQGRVAFAFEQQGTDAQIDEDDFIEVRSKRQLLKEQRELRDKAKIEDLKAKEQIAKKQQKVIRKSVLHEEASMQASSQHPAERWSVPYADVSNEGRHSKRPHSVIGSSLQQFCVCPDSSDSSTAANEPNVFKSELYQPGAVAAHNHTVKERAFGHQYSDDSIPTTNVAWGVQKSAHEVVSLTQIQLEEAMKPFDFGHVSSQMASIPESGPTVLEPVIPLTPSSLDKVSAPNKASVSMLGPISSLLAGEKIQFGAVTSPTVISSSNHPPSPFVGARGSQFGLDKANFPSHSLAHTRNDFRQDSNGTFLSSKIATRVEDDINGQFLDAEAEAMAAASAVAVAAISNDEAVNNRFDANAALGVVPVGSFGSFSKASGVDGIQAGVIQGPSKNFDNTIAAALPADLSLETTAAPPPPSVPMHSGTSEIMLQHLPSRASPFPCLEMGTVLGGPVFAYGPCEDAALSSFEPGLAGLGAGWQHRLSNTSESFYGAPPPFMSPAGLPSIQGHPHMLVYTNPFTQVGHFGVSFMGTTYHPSGKRPDWTHTPYTASPASVNHIGGDVNAGRPPAMDVQHNAGGSNAPQAISAAGSMMPVPSPISVFDPNFPSPFQAQWSRASAPSFPNYHIPGPAPGLNLQPRPGELGLFSQSMHANGNLQQLSETGGFSNDAAVAAAGVRFHEELGFGYSAISNNSASGEVDLLLNRGHVTEREDVPGCTLQQPQNIIGNPNLASVSSKNEPYLSSQDSRSSQLEDSHAQTSGLDHQRAPGHHPNPSHFSADQRVSQQAQGRGGLAVEWQGSNQRRGSSRMISTVSVGERGSASLPKSKQIYVAKPATTVRLMDAT